MLPRLRVGLVSDTSPTRQRGKACSLACASGLYRTRARRASEGKHAPSLARRACIGHEPDAQARESMLPRLRVGLVLFLSAAAAWAGSFACHRGSAGP